jgi:hypothetical protein
MYVFLRDEDEEDDEDLHISLFLEYKNSGISSSESLKSVSIPGP